MTRQFVLFLFAFAIAVVDAGPLRRRRQAPASGIPIPCKIRCSWSLSRYWAEALNFNETINSNETTGDKQNTFRRLCKLYDAHQTCLRDCTATDDGETDSILQNAKESMDEICNARQTQFDQYLPCMSQNASVFRRTCQNESNDLWAASVQMRAQRKVNPDIPRRFCVAADAQARCMFPILRQTCGDGPSDLILSVVKASLALSRAFIADDVIRVFYPDCGAYFSTVQNGVATSLDKNESTLTRQDMSMATPAIDANSTTPAHNTTSIRNDNATDSITHRAGSRPTTASSAGYAIRFTNNFVFFIISMIFCHAL
jgi:hypothetical protein